MKLTPAGYVARGPVVTQLKSGQWSPPLDQLSCVESILLLTGGQPNFRSVEVYANGFHRLLSDLPQDRHGHSANFVNGSILLCGGSDQASACLKGEFSREKSGERNS